ncbi:PriCT-2 domain-containing protein [Magnetofaba australis]|uniref:DNA primase/polymerase bifunctional N-terminal domain-containing protein n=1 Tax=Magnetofaba australis IT-1 TaxID=1434232 RepID=A0A1Y2KA88_9PROT|nr:PriCT-2 domain-containing protein [Magnetofaba australis]OSM07617.1 hypothetical protein MAIT1_04401 [Magnetofaba australis IT-1]
MVHNFMDKYGERLIAGGFSILPIAPGKKYPGAYQRGAWRPYKGWNKHAERATTLNELSIWRQWPDAGIGVACGNVAAIDIDVSDAIIAQQVEDLARERLGDTPAVRIGHAPKRLLVYRTAEPFSGIKQHPLEVLCLGQQFVAYAIHPDTGQPYHWPNASLVDQRVDDLPTISQQQTHDFVEEALNILPQEMRPNRLEKHRDSSTPILMDSHGVSHSGQQGTFEAVSDALRYIVNADLPYDDWVRIGMAIKGALGEAGAALFAEWSACAGKNNPATTTQSWSSFKPTIIGAGTLYHLAQQRGWQPEASITLNPVNVTPQGPHPAQGLLSRVQENAVADVPPSEEKLPFIDGPEWDPLDVDGVLGALVEHMISTATRPQPILAVGNALCALGALMGRRYRTETNLRSNLYIVGIADSGSGKNHSREVITELFMRTGHQSYLGGNRIASGAGLLRAVYEHPAILFQQDEFGMFLQAAADRRRSPRHITDILDLMTELYSSASTTFLGPEYAVKDKSGRKDINQPCLCVYGTTTPVLFWSALRSANVADGSLARFVMLKTRDDYPDPVGANVIRPIPDHLLQAVTAIANGGSSGGGNLSGVTATPETSVEPMIVPMEQGARTVFDELSCQVMSKLKTCRSTQWSSILARVWENASKIALVRGVSANPHAPLIRQEDAVWASALVGYAVNRLIEDVEQHLADNQTEQNHKRVLTIIRAAGRQGIPRNRLTRKTQFLNERERREIVQALLEGGQIVADVKPTRTQPGMVYKAA